jgi:hypothetical protein
VGFGANAQDWSQVTNYFSPNIPETISTFDPTSLAFGITVVFNPGRKQSSLLSDLTH